MSKHVSTEMTLWVECEDCGKSRKSTDALKYKKLYYCNIECAVNSGNYIKKIPCPTCGKDKNPNTTFNEGMEKERWCIDCDPRCHECYENMATNKDLHGNQWCNDRTCVHAALEASDELAPLAKKVVADEGIKEGDRVLTDLGEGIVTDVSGYPNPEDSPMIQVQIDDPGPYSQVNTLFGPDEVTKLSAMRQANVDYGYDSAGESPAPSVEEASGQRVRIISKKTNER